MGPLVRAHPSAYAARASAVRSLVMGAVDPVEQFPVPTVDVTSV
jgi:hypothetical protein